MYRWDGTGGAGRSRDRSQRLRDCDWRRMGKLFVDVQVGWERRGRQ